MDPPKKDMKYDVWNVLYGSMGYETLAIRYEISYQKYKIWDMRIVYIRYELWYMIYEK